ncbi:MAG: hypothetical protein M1454_02590, partial [Candidatus Thermoplasmatota archaeon]|nr:hypothetical protein [Candidatus Thermoplasmatota archaeon]
MSTDRSVENVGYNGIPGISYSVRINTRSRIFSETSLKNPDKERIDKTLDEMFHRLGDSGSRLLNILEFSREMVDLKTDVVTGQTETTGISFSSGKSYVTYDPGYLWIKPLSFNDIENVNWNSPVWHRSFISPVISSSEGHREIYNEHIIAPQGGLKNAINPSDYAAAYDILFLIGRNRSMVFSRGYSLRSFNIGLPP